MTSSPKKYDFTGKVALVTGSSSGIGAAIATQLAKYGAQVAITGRSSEGLEKVAKEIIAVSGGIEPLQIIANLLDDSAPEKLITETLAKYGRLDFLVNNAGSGSPKGSLANPQLMAEFDSVFKLNLRSVVELTQRAVPHLEKTQGSIVNISSFVSMKPMEHLVYCATKAALDMVTKTSALELGPKGIRVNSVNPGPVASAFARSMGITDPGAAAFGYKVLSSRMLMERIGEPEDIANLSVFLLSDDARNITGSIMLSDTGSMLSFPKLTMADFGRIKREMEAAKQET